MTDRNIKPLPPFVTFCQKVIPLAYDESLSYYECLCALKSHIETMDTAVNNNADAVTELQEFVSNYFKNLDVQQEINNKLDDMVTDGTLDKIINQQIFGDINDQINNLTTEVSDLNTNLTNEINTTKTDLENQINTTKTDLENQINDTNEEITKLQQQKITLIIGDSYSSDDAASVQARNGAESWVHDFEKLTPNTVINKSDGGAGFVRNGLTTGLNFIAQYTSVINDETIDKTLIDTIIIYGGINDIDNNVPNKSITDNAQQLAELIKTNTPKAQVYLAFFNLPNRRYTNANISLTQSIINYTCKYGWNYNKCAGWLAGENSICWTNDNYHPNQIGSQRILSCMIAFLNGTEGTEVPVVVGNIQFNKDGVIINTTGPIQNNLYYNPLTARVHGQVLFDMRTGSSGANSVQSGITPHWNATTDLNFTNEVDTQIGCNYAGTTRNFFLNGYTNYSNNNLLLQMDGYNNSSGYNTISFFSMTMDFTLV